jgi:hypothetical protein
MGDFVVVASFPAPGGYYLRLISLFYPCFGDFAPLLK